MKSAQKCKALYKDVQRKLGGKVAAKATNGRLKVFGFPYFAKTKHASLPASSFLTSYEYFEKAIEKICFLKLARKVFGSGE